MIDYEYPGLRKVFEALFLSLMGLFFGLVIFLLHGQMSEKIEQRNNSGRFYPEFRPEGRNHNYTDFTHYIFSTVVNHPFLSALIWFLTIVALVMLVRFEKPRDFIICFVVVPSTFFILVTIQYYVALMQH